VIDGQSVRTSTSVPASSQGTDAGKKVVGRKRSIVTDTLGLLLAVLVTAASVQDSVAGTRLLDQVAAEHPGIHKVWVDGGYRQHLVEHAATLGIDMEISARTPGTKGFTPIPKRWTVERTYGWLVLHCRLARDHGTLPARSEAMIHIAMTDLMARRLTGENIISRRDPTPQTKQPIPGMKHRAKTTSQGRTGGSAAARARLASDHPDQRYGGHRHHRRTGSGLVAQDTAS
jgi:transposase